MGSSNSEFLLLLFQGDCCKKSQSNNFSYHETTEHFCCVIAFDTMLCWWDNITEGYFIYVEVRELRSLDVYIYFFYIVIS